MTYPPRLAPLETMTESDYQWCRDLQRSEHAAFSLVLQYLEKATAEIEAQRLARARARRAALEEAIALLTPDVVAGLCNLARTSGNVSKAIEGRMVVMSRGAAVRDYLVELLRAIRDREEA